MTTPSHPQPDLPGQVQGYIEQRSLRQHPVVPDEVRAIWQKAMNGTSDASQPGLTPDGVVSLAYTALLQAATAILLARGYRVGADQKHHYVVIDAVRAFARAEQRTAFVDLLNKLDHLRQQRAHSVYEAEMATTNEAAAARNLLGYMIPVAQESLLAINPAILAAPMAAPRVSAAAVKPPQKGRGR